MGAGANPAIHHGEKNAALTQALDHLLAADTGAVGFEEDQAGFGLLHFHALDLRQPSRQRAGVGVIVGEPVDVMVEPVNSSSSANAGLAPPTAEALLPAPDLVDEFAGAADDGADRRAEPL